VASRQGKPAAGKKLRITLDVMGEHFKMAVLPGTTISELKGMIQQSHGHPQEQQRLVFNGKGLEDERALRDYNVATGDVVSVVLLLRGC
jgi:Ubiquitin family